MGFWASVGTSVNSAVNNSALDDAVWMKFSGKTGTVAKRLATYYKTETHTEHVLQQLQDFINAMNKNLKPTDDEIFNAIVHAYITKNSQYPERFDTYIAMQYFNQADQKKEDLDGKSSEWFNQKISEVEKHLERISLVKLQLTKNLKELESQGEGHLWIDHEFVDPALDTLKGSLAQVQDIENRMLVLKATYQDYQG
ncbi:hypothetical protein [Acinetobacter sp. YH12127]|uniref:hypothetical protein n=1 Tax=Acinetobacter sp. YH12127 TaxID=2601112 RepID=UPI0015D24F07|nr:hypothetical protein [Acinetobacter sp. YH12127]